MTPEIMRQYLPAHAPELEVVELPEAHTTLWAQSRRSASVPYCPYSSTLG